MIHHVSVAANNPKAVADFFAEAFQGVAIDFPPNPGSYMAFAPDAYGTGVEVYPAGSIMVQTGVEGAAFAQRPITAVERSATHFALSVKLSADQIAAKAAERGWDCFTCDRGGHFHVVEVWIENTWLVELLPPVFAAEYLDFTQQVCAGMGAKGDELMSTHGARLAEFA